MAEDNKTIQQVHPIQQTPVQPPPKPLEPKNVLFRTDQEPKETSVQKNK